MYCPARIAARRATAETSLGFPLIEHSVRETDQFEDHLRASGRYVYDDHGIPTGLQNLAAAEAKWIQNEQAMVQCDHMYALTRYCFVKDEENIISKFQMRTPQKILYDVISQMEAEGSPIEIQILKARQTGMSTIVELLIMLRIVFGYGINAVIASAEVEKSALMARMLFLAYDRLPVWLRPRATARSEESDPKKLVFGTLNTVLSVQHGGKMKGGIAQGWTPTLYHMCISGKTLIRVQNSQVKSIKELTCDDYTLALSGTVVPITAVSMSPRRNELTSEIFVWGTPSALSCTRDHQILTEAGWKQAKDVSNKDWLIYPIRPIEQARPILMDDYAKWKHNKRGIKEHEPTFELGRLVGLYLAEGIIVRSGKGTATSVGYCVHQDENERTREWIETIFGPLSRASMRRRTSKTVIVVVGHRGFAEWLVENVGTKDNKRVPDLCWSLGENFCRGLVYGYLAGDGHYPPGCNEIYATSVRVAIPLGIRELIASLGYGWSNVSFREEGVWYNRNCRSAWILNLAGDTAVTLRKAFRLPTIESLRPQSPLHWHWSTPAHVALSVESIADGFSEDFYDIEVCDPNHAFLSVAGIVHNSEVALFPSPETQIDEGLFRAVHPSTSVFGVLESTGAGDEGWWPDTWHYSKANWPTRSCRLRPLFLPWFCGVEIYPKFDWIRAHPVPAGFYERRLPDTRTHVAKAEAYVSARPEIMKYLGYHWSMPIEQQWFWEVGFNEHKAKGREGSWYQSMAGDDIEALQRSAESIFGHDMIQILDERRKKSYEVYGLTGQSIEEAHEPSTDIIDYAKPRIPLRYNNPRGDIYRWELIPLRHDESRLEVWQRTNTEAFKDYANGKLLVFHPPLSGVDYSVGIDTSNGLGQDSTVISVCAVGQRGGPDTQVAEFRSAYVSHVEAYAFAMAVCAFYAQHMPDSTSHREPKVAVEQLRSVGDVCQLQMIKMGYHRFHHFIRYDKVTQDKASSKQLGWMTTGWSRPILLGTFQHCVENGWFILNSPWTIYEMAHFEMHLTSTGKPKPEHAEGEHDDGIFATAISTFIAHDTQSMTERTAKKFMGDPISKPSLDLAPYAGHKYSTTIQPPVDIDRLL